MPKKPTFQDVFLNLPFESGYEEVFLALIAGTTALGLTPRSVLEVPTNKYRLQCLMEVIGSCRYSIHDLSRVQLSQTAFKCPRFNMPFELGLAIAWHYAKPSNPRHQWIVLESRQHRLQHSLSDLNGHDPFIHKQTAKGTLAALMDSLENPARPVSFDEMSHTYTLLAIAGQRLKKQTSQNSLFTRSLFNQLVMAASDIART